MIPEASILRMRLLSVSATRNPPSAVGAMEWTKLSSACVAGPLSPESPAAPVPAIVVMMPLASTLRARLLHGSAHTYPPPGSGKMLRGWLIEASRA